MIWSYITVLSLGILLGWRINRLINRLSKTAAPATPPATLPTLNAEHPSSAATATKLPLPSPLPVPHTPPPPANHADLTAAMAHHLGQYKAGFLARTSHELRSPLNRVMSLQQLILADLCDNPEEERDFTRKAYEAAEELLELLNQTTTISKLAHGTFPLKLEPVSLNERLSELLLQTQLHAKNRNLCLKIDLPEPDIYFIADLSCLRQVLLNLVTTPIYLMDEGSISVTYEINAADQTVSLYVQDERLATAWSEPVALATQINHIEPNTAVATLSTAAKHWAAQPFPSSAWGLTLMVTTQLVEAMQGQLTLKSSSAASDPHTCIECIFPLVDIAGIARE